MLLSVGRFTFTLQVAVCDPQVAVIVVEPFAIGVTTPSLTLTIPIGEVE